MAKASAIALPADVTLREAASLLGITAPRVQQLVAEGVIARNARNRYPIPATVHAYIKFKSDRSRELAENDKRFRAARADVQEIAAAERVGDLVPIGEFVQRVSEIDVAHIRQLDALGVRIATRYGKDVAAVRRAADEEVRAARDIYAAALSKLGAGLRSEIEAIQAATKKKSRRVGGRGKGATARKRRARTVQK